MTTTSRNTKKVSLPKRYYYATQDHRSGVNGPFYSKELINKLYELSDKFSFGRLPVKICTCCGLEMGIDVEFQLESSFPDHYPVHEDNKTRMTKYGRVEVIQVVTGKDVEFILSGETRVTSHTHFESEVKLNNKQKLAMEKGKLLRVQKAACTIRWILGNRLY